MVVGLNTLEMVGAVVEDVTVRLAVLFTAEDEDVDCPMPA
jgi:hypothetical protein